MDAISTVVWAGIEIVGVPFKADSDHIRPFDRLLL